MKVTEPVLWVKAQLAEVWEVQASGVLDIITGASPQLVTNQSGKPVQTLTGASVRERRTTGDVKVARRFGDFSLGVSRARSHEHDYRSHAYGVDARLDLDQRNTTLAAGFGRSNDRVGSSLDPRLDQPRYTDEYLAGVTQILSPLSLVQSTVTVARGRGWYNDPYKITLTFYPDSALPIIFADKRPDHRDTVAWLTRYRRHFPDCACTLQADYRYYRDDWGIRAHTVEVAMEHALGERWSVRPALRYYTQSAADFYAPEVPRPAPAVLSSDQRLGAFGGLSPSLRVGLRAGGMLIEGTAGYIHDARNLRFGGSGSLAFETLRAVYGLLSVTRPF